MIKIEKNDFEKVLVVYDTKQGVYFYRPLWGIELGMTDIDINKRIGFRCRKWGGK